MVERSKCMNVPNIRFKGFNGEWEKKKLGEVAPLKGGYAFNSANFKDSGIPIVRISNILESEEVGGEFVFYDKIKNEKQFLLIYEDIVIAMSGATTGKIALVKTKNKLYQNQRVGKFSRTSNVDYKYLLALVSSSNFSSELNKLLSSGAQPNVSSSDIDSIKLYFPSCKQEQFLLGSFLERINNIIVTTNLKLASLKRIKAASLQSMFPQEGEAVPKVRFKGFEGEWEKEKLCNIASRITRKNKNLESFTPLTISAIEGLVSQLTYFNNIVASSNISGYYLIKNGEFAYNKSYSNGFPYGSIKRLDKFDMGVLSTLYIVFALNKQNTSILSDYLVIFFNTTLWHHEIAKRAEEGARNHGLLNISAEDFLDINIICPIDLSEQQKIASYFYNLDKQISLQTQRLEKLKQIKAACLDKMFV